MLICWGKANIVKTNNKINILIKRATKCISFRKKKLNISKIKITKKTLVIENMPRYDIGISMHQFKRDILPVNFKQFLTLLKYIIN